MDIATIGVEELEWAKQVLAPYRNIPLTPEQERALSLWDVPAP